MNAKLHLDNDKETQIYDFATFPTISPTQMSNEMLNFDASYF